MALLFLPQPSAQLALLRRPGGQFRRLPRRSLTSAQLKAMSRRLRPSSGRPRASRSTPWEFFSPPWGDGAATDALRFLVDVLERDAGPFAQFSGFDHWKRQCKDAIQAVTLPAEVPVPGDDDVEMELGDLRATSESLKRACYDPETDAAWSDFVKASKTMRERRLAASAAGDVDGSGNAGGGGGAAGSLQSS